MVALDDVEHRYIVTAVKQLLNDMPANETAATNYEVHIFGRGHRLYF